MRLLKALFTAIILCVAFNIYAQTSGTNCPPGNIGFETGQFTGWQCDTGGISKQGVIQIIPSAPIGNRQTIIDSNYYPKLDPYGNFPTLCPYGGKYSIRLGNEQAGARAERVSYSFNIPSNAAIYDVTFYYAVVLQNPKHEPYQQPRFTVNTFDLTDSGADTVDTYDSSGNLISPQQVGCASFNFIASAYLPGFKISKIASKDDSVFYKDWAPATIHLTGFAGKRIRIEFTTNDCTLGAHFGYAYVDVNETCSSPISGATYCSGQKLVTLLAPGGFGSYIWYTGDLSKQIGSSQALPISPPPPDQSKYAVVLIPQDGLGCLDTIYTNVTRINSGFTFAVKDTLFACAGASVDLTASSVTAGSDQGLTYSYYADPIGTQYLYLPQKITESGTYYIKAQSPDGCSNILPVQVVIANPTIEITNPPEVLYPATVDISTTFTHDPELTYSYYTDAALSNPLINYQYVGRSGNYYVKATSNKTGCSVKAAVAVLIGPPAPPYVKAVNTFTPNGDGINDFFSVSIVGLAEFKSLKIYSRSGQLIFQTTSATTPWDGNLNGKQLPPGTYYWLFEGINSYYGTKVIQGGPITLLR